MRLKISSYNTAAFDDATREFGFVDADIVHQFNECASAKIRIADPTGSKLQKYDSDAAGNEIWVGSGRAYLYDDDGNLLFDGRIHSADRANGVLTLTCEDWMTQLKDEKIHYDFREDLDDSGLRVSTAHGETDSGTQQYRLPAYTAGANYYLIDDNMSWDIDEWNGGEIVLDGENFGSVSASAGPYYRSLTNCTGTANGWVNAWEEDGTVDTWTTAAGGNVYGDYWFALLGTEGSLYDGEVTSLSIEISVSADGVGQSIDLQGYDNNLADWAPLGTWGSDWVLWWTTAYAKEIIQIPVGDITDYINSDGVLKLRFGCGDMNAGGHLYIDVMKATLNFKTTGTTTISTISDTLRNPADTGGTYNTLKTADTDFTINGLGIWEGFRYSIILPIYNRINGIVTAGDPLVTLTTSVESTSGMTAMHLSDKSRFEVLQFASLVDKAVFWIPLGTTQVNWKNTTDSTATALKDRDVMRWFKTRYDFSEFYNHAVVYGGRVGDFEVKETVTDSTSYADYDVKKTKVVRDSAIASNYEANVFGTAMLSATARVPLQLSAELAGFSSIRLGDYIQVTSDLLNITAGDYTVDLWEYSNGTTKIRLTPRTTDGYIMFREFASKIQEMRLLANRAQFDKYVAPPKNQGTDVWTNA